MKIVADEEIPYINLFLSGHETIEYVNGRHISRELIKDADVLLVRSVTIVDLALLTGTAIRFVGSMTAGYDHIDTKYCEEAGIAYSIARGCNAPAVLQYVRACLSSLKIMPKRAGVVGVGQVGSRVVAYLQSLGCEVLQHDPPRQKNENFPSTSLADFIDLDVICLHAPLINSGDSPTFHLIDEPFLRRQNLGTLIVSAGRGAVLSFAAVKQVGPSLRYAIDVWEGEPMIDPEVLALCEIATPHIAGYSQESKYRATRMVMEAMSQCFDMPLLPHALPRENPVVLDLLAETKRLRNAHAFSAAPEVFDQLRRRFVLPSEEWK